MQTACPKQYLPLSGMTVLDRTLTQLLTHANVRGVLLGLSDDDSYWPASQYCSDKRVHVYTGGKERSDTVRLGLAHLHTMGELSNEFVLVHDAARPLISHAAISRLVANSHPVGALLAVLAKDTIKLSTSQTSITSSLRFASSDNVVEKTLDRTCIWQAQTPQKFRGSALLMALEHALRTDFSVTDESSAMESIDARPELVEGDYENIKITHPVDFLMATALLSLKAAETV
jgi:2-C-methyl-D-erythritol 4-phosphate cytidylyltransferase